AHFENAGIEKLVIDKEKKAWHFFFSLNKLIPADVMRIFSTQLRTKFTNIASVSFSIRVQSQHVTEEMVQAYWPLCLQELDGIAPPILSLLHNQVPKQQGLKLHIKTRNDTEATAIKKKYAQIIGQVYESYGFPFFQLETEVEVSNKEYEQFLEKKQQEDQEKALLAVADMQKKEKEKDQAGAISGPITIGYTIKDDEDFKEISSILDEERRIAIQGYIFFAETRELRSGRTLLTFKVTDYTDSILVKVFSRDKEDV